MRGPAKEISLLRHDGLSGDDEVAGGLLLNGKTPRYHPVPYDLDLSSSPMINNWDEENFG